MGTEEKRVVTSIRVTGVKTAVKTRINGSGALKPATAVLTSKYKEWDTKWV